MTSLERQLFYATFFHLLIHIFLLIVYGVEFFGGFFLTVPVHGELSDESHVGVVGIWIVFVVEEVEVCSVNSESLSAKLVAWIIFIQL